MCWESLWWVCDVCLNPPLWELSRIKQRSAISPLVQIISNDTTLLLRTCQLALSSKSLSFDGLFISLRFLEIILNKIKESNRVCWFPLVLACFSSFLGEDQRRQTLLSCLLTFLDSWRLRERDPCYILCPQEKKCTSLFLPTPIFTHKHEVLRTIAGGS